LPDVDQQHQGLVEILNTIGDAFAQSHAPTLDQLAGLQHQLGEYTVAHFTAEEALMYREGLLPRFVARHENEHRYFIRELERFRKGTPDLDITENMLRFLTQWLASHILGIDQSMARQVAAIRSGDSADDAWRAEEEVRTGPTQPLLAALHGLFEQVAERNSRLVALNQTLEQRVAERTEELQLMVNKLECEKEASSRLSEELARANRHLEEMAMTDVLTKLPNRRHAMARLEQAWSEATDHENLLAVMMVDVDAFKLVNDTFGHDAGDTVLVALSRELRNGVRTDDVVCRMGGDEFLVVCPRTGLQGAEKVADGLWRRIKSMSIPVGDRSWPGSVSIGVAARQPEVESIAELIKAADDAVYAAKQAGRNRVVVHRSR
jgi:hemerythrin